MSPDLPLFFRNTSYNSTSFINLNNFNFNFLLKTDLGKTFDIFKNNYFDYSYDFFVEPVFYLC